MEKGCYMVAAGKKATTDGSVLVARSEDAAHGNHALRVLAVPRKKHNPGEEIVFEKMGDTGLILPPGVKIPQVSETYAHLGVVNVIEGEKISITAGGVNEFQVCAGPSSGGYINKKAEQVCPENPTSIGDYRCTLVLERCKTAREGIRLLGELTEKFGARIDNYMVGDPNEVWLYEEYRGRLWAAVRIPDDCFVVEANTVRIGEINLNDSESFMGSRDLVSFASEHELYDPKSGDPFNVSKVYGAQTGKLRYGIPSPNYDRHRIWRGISLLAPSTKLDPEEPSWIYPLFVEPDRKLTPRDILKVMMDHYEGTPYDLYNNNKDEYKPASGTLEGFSASVKGKPKSDLYMNEKRQYQLAPVWGEERIIGTTRAVTTYCAQLRSWMPNPIGGVLWAGLAEAATSAHIPWYCGMTRTPEPYTIGSQKEGSYAPSPFRGSIYDEESASWNFRLVSNLVNLFYSATRDEVIPVWREWENKLYKLQPAVEKTAVELYKEDKSSAVEFITDYTCSKANEALDMAKTMITRLHTIIAHYNAPQ